MNAADVKKAAKPRKPCLNFPETLAIVAEIAATVAESQVSVAEISAMTAESQASAAESQASAAESQISVAEIPATTAESQASVAEIAATAVESQDIAAESQVSVAEISAMTAETQSMVAEKKIRRFRGPGKNKKVPVVKEKKAKKEELLARAIFLSSTLPLDSPLRYRYWNNAEKSSKHTVRELKNFFQRYEAI